MTQYRLTSLLALAGIFAFGACSDMDEIVPESGVVLNSQLQEITAAVPERADATISGMYTKLGQPGPLYGSNRPDDFGFIMMTFSNDMEAADLVTPDSGYNWFSTCMELSSRNADYANPYIRYKEVYDEISRANDLLKSFGEVTEETPADIKHKVGQAYAIRAFCYLNLAPYYQFNYQVAADKPCVPLVTLETTDFTNNPRASVAEVYDLIVSDLTTAIECLEGYERPDKGRVNQNVAYGLRARAYLDMGKYADAAADAALAAAGFTPATIEEVSTPSFYDITDHNWIWGYDMTLDQAQRFEYATSSSWIRSFSANGYAPATQVYSCINNLLYNKIPASDVRKGWWVDEKLYSPLLEDLKWDELVGQQIATDEIADVKLKFLPYTNVKFGTYSIGTITNDEDWPFMRVEEMLLIQAEGLIKSGKAAEGIKILNDFVRTYRDPEYDAESTGRKIEDEVWFQRRVELWGEGFSNADTRRLNKPLVRFHDDNSNVPQNFRFNMKADDGWWLLRFCTDEKNTNFGIVDNSDGTSPVAGQNPELRDGVTD